MTTRRIWVGIRSLMRRTWTRWIIWGTLVVATAFNLSREARYGAHGWHLLAEIFLSAAAFVLLAWLPLWTLAGYYLRRKGLE